jgi:hypothetical protein
MTDNAPAWSVLMPVKVLEQAKSRLAALAGERRGELALRLRGPRWPASAPWWCRTSPGTA